MTGTRGTFGGISVLCTSSHRFDASSDSRAWIYFAALRYRASLFHVWPPERNATRQYRFRSNHVTASATSVRACRTTVPQGANHLQRGVQRIFADLLLKFSLDLIQGTNHSHRCFLSKWFQRKMICPRILRIDLPLDQSFGLQG